MKIAIVCSNFINIDKDTKKGTEIFDRILIASLLNKRNLDITAFASGDSDLPVKIESIDKSASISDGSIIKNNKHIIFELALISKAFSMQNNFDLYHINIGDGDIALPFVPFVKKPILITLHYAKTAQYINKYFSLFKQFKNVSFVSVSNAQRNFFPELNYAGTIYHGIEIEKFKFDPRGGKNIIWAGRGIPNKGFDTVLEVVRKTGKIAKLFPIRKAEFTGWLNQQISDYQGLISNQKISIEPDQNRDRLISQYQSGRLFLFPVQWEEPFGLVLIEAMSCGTPVVAYARGSISEIIQDGKTGFLVNPSKTDIRGNWIIKNTGIDGLCEAVEKIYSMKDEEYKKMRSNCRILVEKSFSASRMAQEYFKIYKKLASSQR